MNIRNFIAKCGLTWVFGFACQITLFAVIGISLWKFFPVSESTRVIGAFMLAAPLTTMLFQSVVVSGFVAGFIAGYAAFQDMTAKSAISIALIGNAVFALIVISALVFIGPVPGMVVPVY